MEVYQSLKVLLRRVFDAKFRNERNEFLKHRRWDYRMIYGLQKEGILDSAKRREAELREREKYFGVKHDYTLYVTVGIVEIQLGKRSLAQKVKAMLKLRKQKIYLK